MYICMYVSNHLEKYIIYYGSKIWKTLNGGLEAK